MHVCMQVLVAVWKCECIFALQKSESEFVSENHKDLGVPVHFQLEKEAEATDPTTGFSLCLLLQILSLSSSPDTDIAKNLFNKTQTDNK